MVKARGLGITLLLAMLVLVPAQAKEEGGRIKTSAPVFQGTLTVTLHFQGAQAEVLSQDAPGDLHLLVPEGSRLVKLAFDRPDQLRHDVKPAVVTRSYSVKKRQTIVGGVVTQEDYKDYVDTQVFRWKGLPPGLADLHVESQPDGARLDVTGVEVKR